MNKEVFDYYLDNISYYLTNTSCDDQFMFKIEDCCGISECQADDFRRTIMQYTVVLVQRGRTPTIENCPESLRNAILKYTGLDSVNIAWKKVGF